jgi:hypothetical protein
VVACPRPRAPPHAEPARGGAGGRGHRRLNRRPRHSPRRGRGSRSPARRDGRAPRRTRRPAGPRRRSRTPVGSSRRGTCRRTGFPGARDTGSGPPATARRPHPGRGNCSTTRGPARTWDDVECSRCQLNQHALSRCPSGDPGYMSRRRVCSATRRGFALLYLDLVPRSRVSCDATRRDSDQPRQGNHPPFFHPSSLCMNCVR